MDPRSSFTYTAKEMDPPHSFTQIIAPYDNAHNFAMEGYEGYLLKKNGKFGIWSWRWVVLDRSVHPPRVSLYIKRNSKNAKESIAITGTTNVKLLSQFGTGSRHFSISSVDSEDGKQQKWLFAAGSSQSSTVWLEKLDDTLTAVKNFEMMSRIKVLDESRHDPFGLANLSGGRYKAIEQIGKGSYGRVLSAYDHDTQRQVAIKKVHDVFDDLVDAKRIVREIRALRSFSHDNIIGLLDLPMPPAPVNFHDIFIVTELMDQDLYSVIYNHQRLSTSHIRFILYQILCALKYMHSMGVIHRDLKPQNCLISSDCKVKLCDFGLARGINARGRDSRDNKLTQYIVTRWYRAPEILLACETYSEAVDVWGLGCILGEMLQQAPLFPGKEYTSQTRLILDFVGRPEEDERLDFITNARAKKFVRSLALLPSKIDSDTFFSNEDEPVRYLLRRMLSFNPTERIPVDMALSHKFFDSIRNPKSEKVASRKLVWDKIDVADDELTKSNLQVLIYNEVASFMKSNQQTQMRRNSY